MTREEAKDEIEVDLQDDGTNTVVHTENLIDQIYDDFESRTCENCKFWMHGECENLFYFTNDGWTNNYFKTEKDFGCNKWEQK